jgi:hypothetical protein
MLLERGVNLTQNFGLPQAITHDELVTAVRLAVDQFAGVKVTSKLVEMVKATIQHVLDTYEKEDRFAFGVGKPEIMLRVDPLSPSKIEYQLRFQHGVEMSNYTLWEMPLPVPEEPNVPKVRATAPWYWK